MALPYATEQQVRIIANKIISESKSGGGLKVPTFTPTTFEVDLPDVDILLSSQDCADIIENKYSIITISYAVSAEETISLTFVRNNDVSGIEKGKPYTNLQYDLIADDDEDTYLIGLSFSDNDMKSWCMKISGGGNGNNDYEIDLTSKEEPSRVELHDIYTLKPDRIAIRNGEKLTYYYKQEDSPSSTRLYYSNISAVDSLIFCAKIEYSLSDDEYIFELYTFTLTPAE